MKLGNINMTIIMIMIYYIFMIMIMIYDKYYDIIMIIKYTCTRFAAM